MKKITLIGLILFLNLLCFAQQNDVNWHFGNGVSIDFSGGTPVVTTGGAMNSYEGSSSISDENGNLLLYSNGNQLYNSQHEIIEGGEELHGHISATNAVQFLQHPQNPDQYYVFTNDGVESPNDYGLKYSIVDLSANGGQGEVIEQNVSLLPESSERMALARHCNGEDHWLLTHEIFSDKFNVYTIDENGLNTNPLEQSAGTTHAPDPSIDPNNWYYGEFSGDLKVSATTSKVAIVSEELFLIELFDFDNETGQLALTASISTHDLNSSFTPYSIEFSPDENYMYFSIYGGHIYQADISNPENGIDIVPISNQPDKYGILQMGPDGTIYAAIENGDYLATISNPNASANNINFNHNGLYLQGGKSSIGLPKFVNSFTEEIVFQAEDVCVGEPTPFEIANDRCIDSLIWEYGDNTEEHSTNTSPSHTYASAGTYDVNLTVFKGSTPYSYESSVTVHSGPVDILDNVLECVPDINATDLPTIHDYNWGQGITSSITTLGNDQYEVTLTDEFGCTETGVITYKIAEEANVSVDNEAPIICIGDNLSLEASGADTYEWVEVGSTNSMLTTSPTASTTYTLVGMNQGGCTDTLSVPITVLPLPDVQISTVPSVNQFVQSLNSTVFIQATGAENYTWSNGFVGPSFYSNTTTLAEDVEYIVQGELNGCINTDTIRFDIVPPFDVLPGITSCEDVGEEGHVITFEISGGDSDNYQVFPDTAGTLVGNFFTSIVIPVDQPYSFIITDGIDTIHFDGQFSCVCMITGGFDGDDFFCEGNNATFQLNLESETVENEDAYYDVTVRRYADNSVVFQGDSVQSPINIAVNEPGTYYVSEFRGFNFGELPGEIDTCYGSAIPWTVIERQSDEVALNFGDTTLCPGDSITYFITDLYASFIWNGNLNQQYFGTSEAGTYTVETVDFYGCTALDEVTVGIHPEPDLIVNTNSLTVCESDVVSISFSGTDEVFNGNDLVTSPANFIAENDTVLRLNGVNNTGCNDRENITVTVNPRPNLSLTYSPDTTLCLGTQITLTAAGASSYTWSNGESTAIVKEVPDSGLHTFTVIGINEYGCSNTISQNVIVKENIPTTGPFVECDTSEKYYQVVFEVDVPDTSGIIITPGGTGILSGSTFTSNLIESGIEYSFNVHHNAYCDFINISGVKNCDCPIEAQISGGGTACHGDSLDINIEITGGTNTPYVLNLGLDKALLDIITTSDSSFTYRSPYTGQHDVLYIQNGPDGCIGSSAGFAKSKILEGVTVDMSFIDSTTCSENAILLLANYDDKYDVEWAHTLIDTNQIMVTDSGTYQAVVSNYIGCSDTGISRIHFYEKPILKLGLDTIVCSNSSTVLDAGTKFNNYYWPSTGDTTSFTSINTEGYHAVMAWDANNCITADSVFVELIESPMITNEDSLYDSQIIIKAIDGTPPYEYSLDGTFYHSFNTFPNLPEGVYEAFVKDDLGCIDQASITVTTLDLIIPDFFSPNGDDINDLWRPINIERYEGATYEIYDRYGNLIVKYEADEEGWNGLYLKEQHEMISDTYWYLINLNNGDLPLKGYFLLKR